MAEEDLGNWSLLRFPIPPWMMGLLVSGTISLWGLRRLLRKFVCKKPLNLKDKVICITGATGGLGSGKCETLGLRMGLVLSSGSLELRFCHGLLNNSV